MTGRNRAAHACGVVFMTIGFLDGILRVSGRHNKKAGKPVFWKIHAQEWNIIIGVQPVMVAATTEHQPTRRPSQMDRGALLGVPNHTQ
ncbi:MAG: hypothetical protein JO320_20885 [Alphaproteobacteria bacterium]|nr:hypothetical protein [Alphaproteobacteria bacterium]MBV9814648.1 hypothetical protein [Alphaproteobacteria bacterium]